jgi:hypothetical protein
MGWVREYTTTPKDRIQPSQSDQTLQKQKWENSLPAFLTSDGHIVGMKFDSLRVCYAGKFICCNRLKLWMSHREAGNTHFYSVLQPHPLPTKEETQRVLWLQRVTWGLLSTTTDYNRGVISRNENSGLANETVKFHKWVLKDYPNTFIKYSQNMDNFEKMLPTLYAYNKRTCFVNLRLYYKHLFSAFYTLHSKQTRIRTNLS